MRILQESFDEDERAQALAQFLGCDVSEVSCIDRYEFDAPNGESYYVVDEEEAEQLAKEDIENLFDDMGLESFTEYFRNWIIENALDKDWFEEAVRESTEAYVEDIAYEDGRLEEELLDAGIITDVDVEEGYDVEDAKERYVQYLMDETGDFVDYCGFNFGWDWVSKVAVENNLIDMDVIVQQCIWDDGVAHFIARYDGKEHGLGNGLFAYRNN